MKHLDEERIEELVWDFVSKYLEEKNNLPIMLKDIGYIDDLETLIKEVDFIEDFDSEIEIQNIEESQSNVKVSFGIDAVLSAWGNSKQLLRITVNAQGTCELKSEKNIKIVDFQYDNVECDDAREW